ncbi:hypothetical protein KDK88_09090 [bacterium]|nr:hypothetical protein [bacterium]
MPRHRPPRSSFPVSSCDCNDCRAACTNSPGWFMPWEVLRLAKHLDLSVEDCFRKHLAVGVTHMPDGSQRHGVMPHKLRDGKKPGSVWTLGELSVPGRCSFFDRGLCTIHTVRPWECARMIHGPAHKATKLRQEVVAQWDDDALRPYAEWTKRRLFGSAPKPRAQQRPRRTRNKDDQR